MINVSTMLQRLRAQWGYQVAQYTTGVVYTGLVNVHGQLVIVTVVAYEKMESV